MRDLCPVIWGNSLYTARMLTEIKNKNAKKCFNKQNNHSVHAHSSFLVHFLAITKDYKFHVLWRALRHKTTISFLLFFGTCLRCYPQQFNSRNICLHLTNVIIMTKFETMQFQCWSDVLLLLHHGCISSTFTSVKQRVNYGVKIQVVEIHIKLSWHRA